METTKQIKTHIDVNNLTLLAQKTIQAFSDITAFAKSNGYVTNNSFALTEDELWKALIKISRTQRKVLRNYLEGLSKKITINRANRFMHHVMKVVLKSDIRYRVLIGAKEQAIVDKRKAYKTALAAVRKAYADYKEEKGDFYKK